jgi:hypothetical protein
MDSVGRGIEMALDIVTVDKGMNRPACWRRMAEARVRREGGSALSLGDDRGRSFRRFAGASRQAQQSQRGRRGDKNFLHRKPLPSQASRPQKPY